MKKNRNNLNSKMSKLTISTNSDVSLDSMGWTSNSDHESKSSTRGSMDSCTSLSPSPRASDIIGRESGVGGTGVGGRELKCVVIGDEAVGKTAMIVSYLSNGYPEDYNPTVHDCYSVHLTVDEEPLSFQLIDTAGQEHFSVLRRLTYPDADVFIICFSIIDPYSFKRVQTKWVKELSEYCPNTPVVLVGTKYDQRNNINTKILLNKHGLQPVSSEQGEQVARKIGAKQYVECSALTQKNLKPAFDFAITTALQHSHKRAQNTLQISPTARLRKSIRRLSQLGRRNPGKYGRAGRMDGMDRRKADQSERRKNRESQDSDSSLTSSSSNSTLSESDSGLSEDGSPFSSSTYSKTFDPDRIDSNISIKSQLRSIITCFG